MPSGQIRLNAKRMVNKIYEKLLWFDYNTEWISGQAVFSLVKLNMAQGRRTVVKANLLERLGSYTINTLVFLLTIFHKLIMLLLIHRYMLLSS